MTTDNILDKIKSIEAKIEKQKALLKQLKLSYMFRQLWPEAYGLKLLPGLSGSPTSGYKFTLKTPEGERKVWKLQHKEVPAVSSKLYRHNGVYFPAHKVVLSSDEVPDEILAWIIGGQASLERS